MKKWAYLAIGTASWGAFMYGIGSDLSLVRGGISGILGLLAILLLVKSVDTDCRPANRPENHPLPGSPQ